jgi:hypothetical protein
MTIAAQQNAEIIEPGDNALKLDPVDEKNCERGLLLADVIEEGVLQALGFFGCHLKPLVLVERL